MTWIKFVKYLQDQKLPLTLKKKIFMQTVIPISLYAAETWTTTKAMDGIKDQTHSTQHGTKNVRNNMGR